MTETRRRGEGNKPKADAPKLAPDPNNVLERMFVWLSASHPDSDLEYFAGGRPKGNGSGNCVGMFDKHGIPYRWVDSIDGEKAVIAAIDISWSTSMVGPWCKGRHLDIEELGLDTSPP